MAADLACYLIKWLVTEDIGNNVNGTLVRYWFASALRGQCFLSRNINLLLLI